jgi:hypothetical protein
MEPELACRLLAFHERAGRVGRTGGLSTAALAPPSLPPALAALPRAASPLPGSGAAAAAAPASSGSDAASSPPGPATSTQHRQGAPGPGRRPGSWSRLGSRPALVGGAAAKAPPGPPAAAAESFSAGGPGRPAPRGAAGAEGWEPCAAGWEPCAAAALPGAAAGALSLCAGAGAAAEGPARGANRAASAGSSRARPVTSRRMPTVAASAARPLPVAGTHSRVGQCAPGWGDRQRSPRRLQHCAPSPLPATTRQPDTLPSIMAPVQWHTAQAQRTRHPLTPAPPRPPSNIVMLGLEPGPARPGAGLAGLLRARPL